MGPVREADPHFINEVARCNGCAITKLQFVLDDVVEFVADVVLALHHEVHLVDLFLLSVDYATVGEVTGF